MLENFHLSFSWSAVALVFLLLAVIAFAVFIYRRTNPIVSTFLRLSLTLLRVVALALLLFVIYEATVHLNYRRTNPPILAVAVDNSASMTITDSNGARRDVLRQTLADPVFQELAKKFAITYYSFSNRVEPFSPQTGDSLNFLGDVTNIRETLEIIKAQNMAENLTNILLISDGSYNAGGNPVRDAAEYGVPVYTVGIGSDAPVVDLAIAGVEANPFAYAGIPTPISVTLRNAGFGKLTVPIELYQDGQLVSRSTVQMAPSPSEHTAALTFTPEQVGRHKLQVTVPVQAGERLAENNTRSFYMDVLKARLKILVLAGSVSEDVTFIKKLLTNDRYEIVDVVQKRPGEFYQPAPSAPELQDVDIFIFLDFPTANANRGFVQNLQAALAAKKQPVLLIPGARTSLPDLQSFAAYTPLSSATKMQRESPVYAEPSPLGLNHPVLQVSADPVVASTIWRELPPVFAPFYVQQLAPGAEVLAYARVEGQATRNLFPLIAVRTNGAQKSAAIFAHDLWRWDFLMRGFDRTDDVYAHLLQNLVRWLETNRSDNLVRVTMEKTKYSYGEPITVQIDVFDADFNPVDNAEVRLALDSGAGTQEFAAEPVGNGRYELMLQAPLPGEYNARVTASTAGRPLGEENVLFSVGEYSAELTDVQAQPVILQSLAAATGGKFVTPDSLGQLVSAMHGESTSTPLTIENELWNNKLILAAIILLLTAEWFIRKRRGMV